MYTVRQLTPADVHAVERLLRSSEYIYQRFTLEELPLLLERYPCMGVFSNQTTLTSFLLVQTVNPPVAWIGGFGVSWTESRSYIEHLDRLLEALMQPLHKAGVQDLYYSGSDMMLDWLRPLLMHRQFEPDRYLYSYDKYDYAVPTQGNQQVTIRPVNPATDMPALLTIEHACFEELWRYDEAAFRDIARTHPYFVVAEQRGHVVGYQFNALDAEMGYLIRIAVHPSAERQGIGARLMTEAVRFFERHGATRIMLNTEEQNVHAHRLYEWFGFTRLPQTGFVLRRSLENP
uniref:N-acetyltransferase n=1 Tax=Thermosporothrix sp. COM3 TaxID=2490863 RepID=A0A455SQ47_9CHLR|nr:N-acetyltransferase [Thermosporothrix sp. COM3]